MAIRPVLILLGILLAVGGVLLASRTVQVNYGNQCTVDQGCRTNGPIGIPTVGIGMAVFVVGLVTAIYGYRRVEEPSET